MSLRLILDHLGFPKGRGRHVSNLKVTVTIPPGWNMGESSADSELSLAACALNVLIYFGSPIRALKVL